MSVPVIMRRNIGARWYAGRCAKMFAQSARYVGHVDGNMDFFFPSGHGMMETPGFFSDSRTFLSNTNIRINVINQNKPTKDNQT